MARIVPPSADQPIVDKNGKIQQTFGAWTQLVSRLGIITGSGTPEASVDAPQTSLYMDTAGTAGNILYIKRDTAVAGDTTKGWILV